MQVQALPLTLGGIMVLLTATMTVASPQSLPVLDPTLARLCDASAPDYAHDSHSVLPELNDHLRVVVIGSSSTAGAGASRPQYAYVNRFRDQLLAHAPHAIVINKGVGGNVLTDIIRRAGRDVYAQHPDLVVLQTGTNDARQGIPPAQYRHDLSTFVKDLQRHHLNVVLIDNQYIPDQLGSGEYQSIIRATRDVAHTTGVPLVSRYALGRTLVERGGLNGDDLIASDRLHPNDLMHACTGRALTATVLATTD
ncbi:SGNH/GDSL hydrolase family protein [Deinococcus aquiradiocola]|uniref:SGNH hydrolase-type esterase domain-containing protein n=1 Tax=Deinococcus aquiradiocola TaxID=393059 RepID=A0A917P5B7_9DEIO|nr:SGNH/GDSL hydrolase family protein [Deinococcus aquiradiocola]GGJ62315.1 hypothetical protein GCM10008939_02700 [Deinococcus aquiradiocola]